jgi:hypothetical protein
LDARSQVNFFVVAMLINRSKDVANKAQIALSQGIIYESQT